MYARLTLRTGGGAVHMQAVAAVLQHSVYMLRGIVSAAVTAHRGLNITAHCVPLVLTHLLTHAHCCSYSTPLHCTLCVSCVHSLAHSRTLLLLDTTALHTVCPLCLPHSLTHSLTHAHCCSCAKSWSGCASSQRHAKLSQSHV
jgi:hypothetical protein